MQTAASLCRQRWLGCAEPSAAIASATSTFCPLAASRGLVNPQHCNTLATRTWDGGRNTISHSKAQCRGDPSQVFTVPKPSGTPSNRGVFVRSAFLLRGEVMRKVSLALGGIALAMALGLSACANPYDPGQRAVGGGLIGAGAGAAIGGAVGGGTGAAIGAASGGALGAITGAATTPPPPRRY